MNFKLTTYPCLDSAREAYTIECFETRSELIAAKVSCANLLLFLQDKLKVIDDESNLFICEEIIEGEWQEVDLQDYE